MQRGHNEPNMTDATRVAFQTSDDGNKPRWTELEVWRLAHPMGRNRFWHAEARGHSRVPGERTRIERVTVGSLARALKLFDETTIARALRIEAEEWAHENGERGERAHAGN